MLYKIFVLHQLWVTFSPSKDSIPPGPSFCVCLFFLFPIPSRPYSGLLHSLAVLVMAHERKTYSGNAYSDYRFKYLFIIPYLGSNKDLNFFFKCRRLTSIQEPKQYLPGVERKTYYLPREASASCISGEKRRDFTLGKAWHWAQQQCSAKLLFIIIGQEGLNMSFSFLSFFPPPHGSHLLSF